jgi:hypothetical protein
LSRDGVKNLKYAIGHDKKRAAECGKAVIVFNHRMTSMARFMPQASRIIATHQICRSDADAAAAIENMV